MDEKELRKYAKLIGLNPNKAILLRQTYGRERSKAGRPSVKMKRPKGWISMGDAKNYTGSMLRRCEDGAKKGCRPASSAP